MATTVTAAPPFTAALALRKAMAPPPIEDAGVSPTPDDVRCAGCGRVGTATEAMLGWSFDVPPRPTGSTEPARSGEASYLCPECTRRRVRDVDARLDF